MHHFISRKIVLCSLLIIASTAAIAAPKEAGTMNVQIGNMTQGNCQLTDSSLLQGAYITVPPQAIQSGDSKEFKAQQKVRGPKVSLSYKCNNGSITFVVHQHLVVATGSKPTAEVVKANGLALTYKSTSSSVIWKTAGILNITLSNS